MPGPTPKRSVRIADMPRCVKSAATAVADNELVLLALAAPFLLFPNRWTAAALVVILLTWLCRWLAFGRLTWRTAMDLPIALLLLMGILGAVISVDLAMSRAKLWGLVLQATLFFGLVNGLHDERSLRTMAGILVGLTGGVALLGLVGTDWGTVRLIDLPWLYERLPRLVAGLPGSGVPRASTLFHPREVGATLAMLLPIPAALLIFGRDRRLRLLSALALAVGGTVLLLTQSPQALLGLALALLLIAGWRSRWFLLSIPVGLLATAAALWACGPSRAVLALLSLDHPIGSGVVLRLDIWSRALAMIRDMPFTGIGLNTFPLILTHFYPGVLVGPEAHAHNLYLQTAVDLGLPGLFALLWLILAFFVVLVQAYRVTSSRDLRVVLIGLAAGVVAYLGHGLLDTVTLGAKPVAGLFLMLGLAAAVLKVGRQAVGPSTERQVRPLATTLPADHSGRRSLRRFLPGVLLLGLLALWPLASPARASLNLGAIRAHQMLIQARRTGAPPAGGFEAALGLLERAARQAPSSVSAHNLLGSLYAWEGDPGAATDALERAAVLDIDGAVVRYEPWILWKRLLEGTEPPGVWQDLIAIYTQWMTRYPDRAEAVLQVALIYDRQLGDRGRARSVLQSGLEQGATPAGLLTRFLAGVE
jgi:putative inorganic carbon (hco3(-)) transporter